MAACRLKTHSAHLARLQPDDPLSETRGAVVDLRQIFKTMHRHVQPMLAHIDGDR